MADRFGSDLIERALAMQEGSVLANEVLRLRVRIYELEIGNRSAVARGDELMLREGRLRAELERLQRVERRVAAALDNWDSTRRPVEVLDEIVRALEDS